MFYIRSNQEDLSRRIKALGRIDNVIQHLCVYYHGYPTKRFSPGGIIVDAHGEGEQREGPIGIQRTNKKDTAPIKQPVSEKDLCLVVWPLSIREIGVQRGGESHARVSQIDGGSIWVGIGQFELAPYSVACNVDDSIPGIGNLVVVWIDDGLQKKERFPKSGQGSL